LSVWCTTPQKMAITIIGHPLGASEVTLPRPLRTLRLTLGIDVQNNVCNLAPIGPFGIRVKETQVRYQVLFVVTGQDWFDWSDVRYRRI
jgi:hypothetical protein